MNRNAPTLFKKREIATLKNGLPVKVERETWTESKPKIDHAKEMRNGLIYFTIGCLILAVFIFTVLRPFEKNLVNEAHAEYKILLEQHKEIVEERNGLVDTLRDFYKND